MAVLTTEQLAPIRRNAAEEIAPRWTKPQINAGLQAIEDWFEANRLALGSAIETAAPGVFNATQKRLLVKCWLLSKFERGG
jgi:hypothetical protein